MDRRFTPALLLAVGTSVSCTQTGSVRSFSGPECPREWQFVYTDHVERQIVCRRLVDFGTPEPEAASN